MKDREIATETLDRIWYIIDLQTEYIGGNNSG